MLSVDRLTHWSIPAKDLEESESFYGDFLGHENRGRLNSQERRATAFRAGDTNYIIWETGVETDPRVRESGVHFAFTLSPEVWDLAIREIHKRSVPLWDQIVYRQRGHFPGREVYVLDPSKNVVELTDPTWKPGMPTPTFEEILSIPA